MEYNCSLIKVDWLYACIALRVVGAVLVVFLRRWRKICTILLQPIGKQGPIPEDIFQICWPIRNKETWIKYTPLTLLSHKPTQTRINREKYTFCVMKSLEHLKKNWPRPLFGPRTDHACPQKPNPSRETVPVKACGEMMESGVNCLVCELRRIVLPPLLLDQHSLQLAATVEK